MLIAEAMRERDARRVARLISSHVSQARVLIEAALDWRVRASSSSLGVATLHEAGGRVEDSSRACRSWSAPSRPAASLSPCPRATTRDPPRARGRRRGQRALRGELRAGPVWRAGDLLLAAARVAGVAGIVIDDGIRDYRAPACPAVGRRARCVTAQGNGQASRPPGRGRVGRPSAECWSSRCLDGVVGDRDGVCVLAAANVVDVVARGTRASATM